MIFIERFVPNELRPGYQIWLHPLAFMIFVYVLSFYAFKQPLLYVGKPLINNNGTLQAKEPKSVKKNGNSEPGLKEELKQIYLKKLNAIVESEKPYLDSKLRITDLAKKLEIPVNHLSKIINEEYEKNFFQYINDFRIKHAQEMLKDKSYQNYTLVAIALESGFNSKSSFNSLFKQHSGYTPSEFRKQIT